MAGSLGVFDCSGVADGGAAAIIVRAEDADKYTDTPLYIKGLQFISGTRPATADPDYDYTHFPEIEQAGKDAYAQAGVTDPARRSRWPRCTTASRPAELLIYEDLGFAERGTAWKEVLERHLRPRGRPAREPRRRAQVVRPPGRRVGLRMFFENWLQLTGQAPEERRIKTADRGLGLVHNLGGYPGEMVSFVGIVGTERD